MRRHILFYCLSVISDNKCFAFNKTQLSADIGAFVRLSLSVCVPLFLHLLACSPDSPPTADKAEL